MATSFTKLRLLFRRFLHYPTHFSTFACNAVCRWRRTLCRSVGALHARCVSARRRSQFGVLVCISCDYLPISPGIGGVSPYVNLQTNWKFVLAVESRGLRRQRSEDGLFTDWDPSHQSVIFNRAALYCHTDWHRNSTVFLHLVNKAKLVRNFS
jgi:hypothetical protein